MRKSFTKNIRASQPQCRHFCVCVCVGGGGLLNVKREMIGFSLNYFVYFLLFILFYFFILLVGFL